MAEEERACAVCRVVTTHYDGACEQCLIRKDSPPAVPVQHPVVAQPHERTGARLGRQFMLPATVILVALIIGAGFVHIVRRGGRGSSLCAKESWSLSDTFVDADDFIDKPLITLLDRGKVVRALARCGILTMPDFDSNRGTHTSQDCMRDPLADGCN